MPKPVFIICSESGSVDRFTNLLSIHNIIERLSIRKRDERDGGEVPDGHAPWLSIRVTALWEAEDDDRDERFEYQVGLRFPEQEEKTVAEGEFMFKSRNYRFVIRADGPPPSQDGSLIASSRIRRTGDDVWLSQEYEIEVEMTHEETAATSEPE